MNADYKEPTIEFLREWFKNIPFGMVKPSELEMLMFYVLAYHNGDLDKSVYELADMYKITERKAAAFKTGIINRFVEPKTARDYVRGLAREVFEKRSITLEWEGTKIGIPVYDACYCRAFKQCLSENQLPYDTGNNGNLIRLTTWNFIAIFARCGYTELRDQLKATIAGNLKDKAEQQKLFDYGVPLSYKIKSFLKDNSGALLGAIPGVKDMMTAAKAAAAAVS